MLNDSIEQEDFTFYLNPKMSPRGACLIAVWLCTSIIDAPELLPLATNQHVAESGHCTQQLQILLGLRK